MNNDLYKRITQTSKTIMRKMMLNGLYGKYGDPMGIMLERCTIKPGYKGEWVITYPFYNQKQIIEWCRETFGPDGHDRKYRWRNQWAGDDKYRLFLRHECDVTLFTLKWC